MHAVFVEWLSGALWWMITIWGLFSLGLFVRIVFTARQISRQLRDRLYNILRSFRPPLQPDRDSERQVYDEIAVLLQAFRELVTDPARTADLKQLDQWIADRDADKLEMKRHRFERWYNFARVQIEVLPLAGICGTLGRMAYALNQPSGSAQVSDEFMLDLTTHFANSLASTLAALVFTIFLLWINAVFEPSFARLIEERAEYRDIVALARRALAGLGGSHL